MGGREGGRAQEPAPIPRPSRSAVAPPRGQGFPWPLLCAEPRCAALRCIVPTGRSPKLCPSQKRLRPKSHTQGREKTTEKVLGWTHSSSRRSASAPASCATSSSLGGSAARCAASSCGPGRKHSPPAAGAGRGEAVSCGSRCRFWEGRAGSRPCFQPFCLREDSWPSWLGACRRTQLAENQRFPPLQYSLPDTDPKSGCSPTLRHAP